MHFTISAVKTTVHFFRPPYITTKKVVMSHDRLDMVFTHTKCLAQYHHKRKSLTFQKSAVQSTTNFFHYTHYVLTIWLSGNALASINVVALRQT